MEAKLRTQIQEQMEQQKQYNQDHIERKLRGCKQASKRARFVSTVVLNNYMYIYILFVHKFCPKTIFSSQLPMYKSRLYVGKRFLFINLMELFGGTEGAIS